MDVPRYKIGGLCFVSRKPPCQSDHQVRADFDSILFCSIQFLQLGGAIENLLTDYLGGSTCVWLRTFYRHVISLSYRGVSMFDLL
jgi:hypothetical protein